MNSEPPIRLLLVDDHPLVLDGISSRLEDEPGFQVVGQACNGKEALEVARKTKPDLVLMDLTMPVMGGLEATRHFRKDLPAIKVLILSMHDTQEYIAQVMESGASGYVLKDVASGELIKAIRQVHQGETYLSTGASETLSEKTASQKSDSILTCREETVLSQIAAGQCNKEIARNLDISVRTVETHRLNMKKKLDIQNTAGLIKFAIENGIAENC